MVELHFDSFDWDEGNRTKSLKKHGLNESAIEAFFETGPTIADDVKHSGHEPRFLAVGKNPEGRWMIVSFTLRAQAGRHCLRPISARYMHAREVKDYEKA